MLRWVIRENSPMVSAVAMCPRVAPPAGGESRAFLASRKGGRTLLTLPAREARAWSPGTRKGGPDDPDRKAPAARRQGRSGQAARKGCGHRGCAVRRDVPGRSGRLDDGGRAAVHPAVVSHVPPHPARSDLLLRARTLVGL